MSAKQWIAAALAALMLMALLSSAAAETAPDGGEQDGVPFRLITDEGQYVTTICYPPAKGDEYISRDNRHYRVTDVDESAHEARVELLGVVTLPDVSFIDDAVTVSATSKVIAIYCTHSDESYEPTDGTSSDASGEGGIYDVAGTLAEALREKGVTVNMSDESHLPHDAGAYRRSRSTAAELLEQGADALLDVHRDGIPDPSEYEATVNGEDTSMVRLLVGRSNQNSSANQAFAKQLKAVADKAYPGLIKDIYIGKGNYNQDLYPRAILLELGTHTIDKELAVTAADKMADVIYRTLYGSVTGSAGASDVTGKKSAGEGVTAKGGEADTGGSGVWTGLAIVLGLAVIGALIYGYVSTGSWSGMWRRFGRTFQQLGGGLFGRKS